MSTYTYSEKELADKLHIETETGLNDGNNARYAEVFQDAEANRLNYSCWVEPPTRCSDGKRRGFLDYIDFLFPDTPLEDLLAQKAASGSTYRTIIQVKEKDIYVTIERNS